MKIQLKFNEVYKYFILYEFESYQMEAKIRGRKIILEAVINKDSLFDRGR